jgi:hypothetical protein
MRELGRTRQGVDNFRMEQIAPGALLLDYGDGGRFRVGVTEQND